MCLAEYKMDLKRNITLRYYQLKMLLIMMAENKKVTYGAVNYICVQDKDYYGVILRLVEWLYIFWKWATGN